MRIAVVGNGRSVHTISRAAAIAAQGQVVRLVTLGQVLGRPDFEVRTRPIPQTLPTAVRAARGFVADIRRFEPDLLHLHYAGGRLGTMATLSRVGPLVVTVMGGDVLAEQHPGGAMSRLERRATRRILGLADLVLVKSDKLRPAVRAFGVSEERLETVRWGIDPAVFHRDDESAGRLQRRLGLGEGDRVILSPRILRPLYNIHRIVEAMPRVLATVPEAVLLVAEHNPDAAYRERVSETARILRLGDRVRFIDQLDHSEMPGLYSLAEAVVMIPSSDGLPQSLFEAAACGTPIVLSRLEAYGEVVADARHALLVEGEAGAVGDALVRLLRSRSLRASLAEAALGRVREMAMLPDEAQRVVALYSQLRDGQTWTRTRPFGWQETLDLLLLALRR